MVENPLNALSREESRHVYELTSSILEKKMPVHCIFQPGRGRALCSRCGSAAQVIGHDGCSLQGQKTLIGDIPLGIFEIISLKTAACRPRLKPWKK